MQTVRLPPCNRSHILQSIILCFLKDLDHEVGVDHTDHTDHLSEVWNIFPPQKMIPGTTLIPSSFSEKKRTCTSKGV